MTDGAVDFAVVGAGIGGLAAGALLARRGLDVVVLEASGLPGGCAQTFRRGPFRFDAGATTIVGADPRLPVGRLARELDIDFGLDPIDPGMSVWLGGGRIDRHTDRARWVDTAAARFGARQRRLWATVFETSDLAWGLAARADRYPPAGLADAFHTLARAGLAGARLAPALVASTAARVRSALGVTPPDFARFLDEQLLITAQAYADRVPFAVGALGLSYTNYGCFTAPGGVGGLAGRLAGSIAASGGRVLYGRRVERIEQESGGYRLATRRGEVRARGVISNLTAWDLAGVCSGELGAHFARSNSRPADAWGAFTLYLGVRDTFGGDPALHHQVIFDEPLPVTGSRSLFLSLSPRGEAGRAPHGMRAATVSTHTPTAPWWRLERGRYEEARERVADALVERVASHSGLGRLAVEARLPGTPRTFQRYTFRHEGRVGGVPSTFAAVARPRGPVTPFPDFYLVGDTVYPGQGIPAVVLGALNVAGRIASVRIRSIA